MTVVFHFLLTSLFSWLLAQSWHTYVQLGNPTKNNNSDKINTCLLIGYGFPFFVSLFGLAVLYDSYGLKTQL